MKATIHHIGRIFLQWKGIDISRYDVAFLSKSVQKRTTETDSLSAEAYIQFLEHNNDEKEILLNSLFNSYTDFFRNPLTFAVLERIVIPSLIRGKGNNTTREIRIWSAACAAGQEAYSLAMLFEEFNNGRSENPGYRIFATDWCEAQINEAKKGTYTAQALNNLSMKRVNQWFTKSGDSYVVKPELRRNIDFSVFDLFNEKLNAPPASIFGDFDLIICANLLFYYKPEFQKVIVEKTGNCLTKDAYFVVGATERVVLQKHNYHEVFPHSGIFQKLERG